MSDNDTKKKNQDDEKTKVKERGTKDDWESLKVVLDAHPALKQRVLHKLRQLKDKEQDALNMKISRRAQADYRRESKKRQQKE